MRQFTEAGIPLVDELANKFSQLEGRVVSAGEVFDRISRRMVSFEMVKDVLWSLTSEGGKFFNMQAELAESLAGKWSNLRDSFDVMLSEIAEGANGPLKGTLELLTSLMNNWERVAVVLGGLVTIYGSYRAAVIIMNALTAKSIIQQNGLAAAAVMAARALNGEAVAAANMNRAAAGMITRLNGMKGALAGIGKGGWIGIVVGLLASVAMYIYDSARAANELRDALDDVGDRARSSADIEIARYKQLVDKIEEAGMGTKERADLIAETNQRYGNYLGNLLSEADANEKVRASIDSVTEAIRRRQQAEAYEEGVSKINEKYTKEMSDLREELEDISMGGILEMDERTAKNFISDVLARLKAGMSKSEVEETANSVMETYGMPNAIYAKYLTEDLRVGKVDLMEYVELLGEMEEEMKNWGDSMDGRFAGIEFYADRIREIEKDYEELGKKMENTPEAQRGVKLAMYEEMLGVFPQETDDKYINDYKAKIKREIEELMKEIPGWVKKAEEAGRSDTVLSTLIPREDEREDVLKYIERVAKEYKEAEAEIAKRGSFNVEDPGNQRELEAARRQLEGMKALGKELGIDWSLFGESKRTEGDSATEALKERLRLIKEAMSLYERFLSLEGEAGASERVKGVFSGLFSGGFSAEEYRKALADIEKEAFKLPAGKGRTGLLSETGKLRLEIDENELRDGMNRAVEVIEATRENWDLYSDLSKGGMDKERAMAIAFGGKVDFKSLAEELRGQLRAELKGGMAVDDILGMGESEVKARFGEDSAIGKYYAAIKEEEKKAREASAETISETLAKYKGYFEQRSDYFCNQNKLT